MARDDPAWDSGKFRFDLLKRWTICAGAVVIALSAQSARAQVIDVEQMYDRLAPSVWVVRVQLSEEKGALGSAVVIAPETLITNCHVVKNALRIIVSNRGRVLPARLQYQDPTRDICQLDVTGLNAPAVQIAASATLHPGQKVYALGNPRGLDLTISDGLVSALRRGKEGELVAVQISVPISHGSSGGGLFDAGARLVGITSAGFDDSQNLNFALPTEWVVDLPARVGATAVARLERQSLVSASPPVAVASVQTAASHQPVSPPGVGEPVPTSPTKDIQRSTLTKPVAAPPAASGPQQPSFGSAASSSPQTTIAGMPDTASPHRPDLGTKAGAVLFAGRRFKFRVVDRLTSIERSVIFEVDRLDAGQVSFNHGSRVETLDGEVLKVTSLIAGEFEAAMPPGGWVKPGTKEGDAWTLSYRNSLAVPGIDMKLHARANGSRRFGIAGREFTAIRVEFDGYTTRGDPTLERKPTGPYSAIAWYAPELGRVVRFEVRTRGGVGGAAFVIDEITELVGIQ